MASKTKYNLTKGESVTLDSQHGAIFTVRFEGANGPQGIIEINGHHTRAKADQLPGPLSVSACDSMILAIREANQYLSAAVKKDPKAAEALAMCVRAQEFVDAEIAKPKIPPPFSKK